MVIEYRISKKGVITQTVIDREGNKCSDVQKMSQRMGRETYHEVTGPECPVVDEVVREVTVS